MNPIPAYYVPIAVFVSFVFGWAAREFNVLHLGTKYDKAAESVENLTGEEAQSLADVFQTIASRLKTSGK